MLQFKKGKPNIHQRRFGLFVFLVCGCRSTSQSIAAAGNLSALLKRNRWLQMRPQSNADAVLCALAGWVGTRNSTIIAAVSHTLKWEFRQNLNPSLLVPS